MGKTRALLVVVGAIALCSCAGGEDSAAKGALVIAQAKAATGGEAWDRIRFWYERGRASPSSGDTVEYEHWGDLHTLSVRNSNSRSGYMVFDGTMGYVCADADCTSRTPLDGRGMRTGAYLASFGFFFPDRFPASFEYRGTQTDSGTEYEVVRVAPTGMDVVEIWVDSGTQRVARLVQQPAAERTDLSDYRRVGDVLVPFGSRVADLTVQVSTVRFDPPDAAAVVFTPPSQPR